jgi:hypothetical protein
MLKSAGFDAILRAQFAATDASDSRPFTRAAGLAPALPGML